MKILHISSPKSWRGGEQQIAYLHEELQKLEVEQVIICRKGSVMEEYCRKTGLAYYALSKRTSIDLFFARKLAQIARTEKMDIVHPHDSHAHTFTVMAASLFGLQQPIVLHRRVDYPVKDSAFSRYKYNHPQIKKIICVSHEVKRILDQSLKDPSRSVVVHSGIDTGKFVFSEENILTKELGISPEKTLIGNVAAITQQKDYFTFVETAEILLKQRQDVHFCIIGTGDQKEEIEDLVKSKGLDSHISFTGFRQDIQQVLPCLEILLFTSEKEGLGTTLLDALAARVPVVATEAGGIPEIIENHKTGLLAPVKNPGKLAEQCLKLLDNKDLQQQFREEGSQKVKRFSKENMGKKVLNIYNEVLASATATSTQG